MKRITSKLKQTIRQTDGCYISFYGSSHRSFLFFVPLLSHGFASWLCTLQTWFHFKIIWFLELNITIISFYTVFILLFSGFLIRGRNTDQWSKLGSWRSQYRSSTSFLHQKGRIQMSLWGHRKLCFYPYARMWCSTLNWPKVTSVHVKRKINKIFLSQLSRSNTPDYNSQFFRWIIISILLWAIWL